MELGEKLLQARRACHLSQDEAGELTGLTHSAISQYEQGKRTPSLGILNKLAHIYGHSIEYFMDMAEETEIVAAYRSENKANPNFTISDLRKLADVRNIVKNLAEMRYLEENG